ncbi:polysaccharide lyase [Paraglaciecola aquimarina]|uniref:Polysaccharide lyase n=1 Tax=Paraglaciecola algarum TaxID=3050085 RepID=A0ABS9D7X4_9ALTE|nr:polysaccharide lyase [Paraglaciecola sp. G1-23]MCF2948895.1 polysaccharide lyase [Paraglaciecola sp. G1-23]
MFPPKLIVSFSAVFTSFYTFSESKLEVNFNNSPIGPYQKSSIVSDWPQLKWQALSQRAEIVPNDSNDHSLKIYYPKGAVGPSQGGGQFLLPLQPATDLWLSYQVKFDPNFDFRLGGKLPGLTSGGSKYTGGNKPTKGEGWSARYMWREDGEAIIYLYYMDMKGKWGDDLTLAGFHFQPNEWHTLVQHIRINDMQQSNGVLEVWIDGDKKLSKTDLKFRAQETAIIDSFYFSTFHGGNTKDWAPKHDSYAYFDNFIISKTALVE